MYVYICIYIYIHIYIYIGIGSSVEMRNITIEHVCSAGYSTHFIIKENDLWDG